jgi:hypothetical protein
MNSKFIKNNLKKNDLIRITTNEAIGVIGRVDKIDLQNDGLVLKEIKEAQLLNQIENAMTYEKVLFPMVDIKYIFVFNLEIKPIK